MGSCKTVDEWNKAFFEERMSYLNCQPKTAAPSGPSYRKVLANTYVSNESPGPRVFYISDEEVKWKPKDKWEVRDISDQFTEEDIQIFYETSFPLDQEKL